MSNKVFLIFFLIIYNNISFSYGLDGKLLKEIIESELEILDTENIKTQYPYVLLLALLTTAIGHTLFINSLKYFKASTASIIGSSQPIFGIIIAYFFLNEIPTIHTFVGGALILSTVVIESIRSKNK